MCWKSTLIALYSCGLFGHCLNCNLKGDDLVLH
ncbi:hypothetical protein GLYMA_09G234650v4 [Glycine max]|nr:hypothetical protein GLYMA_09G234650v4 [Glycine max]